ncbi:hypothetical protein SORBI_3007G137201 [Sorghum bicolor]|uniref:Uncharacterized protein n=1 Tax=Sorghum bicolor TaxID=4558 RepID=A0A1Z5R9T0_SORBI|nr:hypothetical protein SORBI_3007G137201 [Sorghum bicolor]
MASKKELMRGTPALTHSLTHRLAATTSHRPFGKGIGEGKGAGIERERESLVDPRESGKGVRQDAKLNAHEEEEQLLLCVCQ